jgi:hypothetical protein
MASNRIRSLNTATLESPNGPVVAIMMALDIAEVSQLDDFLNLVVEKFKAHRMCSPPETAALLVTIIGNVSAEHFAQRWAALTSKDQILRRFMAEMQLADVLLGTDSGEVIEMVSLRDSVK